jgi:putative phosphoribosyl transferase
MVFRDRRDAGRRLATELAQMDLDRPVIVALPRGGVPVAYEVAAALGAPLDVLAVRKLGAPGHPEFGVGAVAEDDVGVLDPRTAGSVGMEGDVLEAAIARESAELRRRVAVYRDGRPPVPLQGRTAVIVDDGVATGLTDLAALRAVRKRGAARVVVAVPVGAPPSLSMLRDEADDVVCLCAPTDLGGVGRWYDDFSQVPDEVVVRLLAEAGAGSGAGAGSESDAGAEPGAGAGPQGTRHTELSFALDGEAISGELTLPGDARGLVLFAHGSGSSRHSPRNRAVAAQLNQAGLATLLFDLLTEREAADRARVFDIPLLAERLASVSRWTRTEPALGRLALGYFGASTGAAAALVAAAELTDDVRAVVSRGGRPDLAGRHLEAVRAPTLLIVGSLDTQVLALNREAARQLGGPSEVAVVPGAGHLFEEPGTLDAVSGLAADWFGRHLAGAASGSIVEA